MIFRNVIFIINYFVLLFLAIKSSNVKLIELVSNENIK